jgi:site-specific DNA-cytosine methylase
MGWECATVDVNPRYEPDILADVRDLHFKEGEFDVIWASPPCEHYSIAKTGGERSLPHCDSIAQACLRIIDEVKPLAWIVENPMGLSYFHTLVMREGSLEVKWQGASTRGFSLWID